VSVCQRRSSFRPWWVALCSGGLDLAGFGVCSAGGLGLLRPSKGATVSHETHRAPLGPQRLQEGMLVRDRQELAESSGMPGWIRDSLVTADFGSVLG
jgi:hypothetical protein